MFEDGSEPRITSAAVLKELGLAVDSDVLEAGLAEAESVLAKERALRLLGYRERSAAELTRKLGESGYDSATVAPIVARFIELGLVDDERFAGMWVRSRVAAGQGAHRIQRELAEKGVAPQIISAALERDCAPDTQVARARESLRGRRPADRKERDRLVRRLVTRGYDLSTALQAVSEAANDFEEPPES